MFGFRVHRIVGQSMMPCLANGDYVLSLKRRSSYRIGDIVIVQHPEWGKLVKRISSCRHDAVLLKGENPEASLSSERMGWQSTDHIIGRVVFHIAAQ